MSSYKRLILTIPADRLPDAYEVCQDLPEVEISPIPSGYEIYAMVDRELAREAESSYADLEPSFNRSISVSLFGVKIVDQVQDLTDFGITEIPLKCKPILATYICSHLLKLSPFDWSIDRTTSASGVKLKIHKSSVDQFNRHLDQLNQQMIEFIHDNQNGWFEYQFEKYRTN